MYAKNHLVWSQGKPIRTADQQHIQPLNLPQVLNLNPCYAEITIATIRTVKKRYE